VTDFTKPASGRMVVKAAGFNGGTPATLTFAPGQTVQQYLDAARLDVPDDASVSLNGRDVAPDYAVTEQDVVTPDTSNPGVTLAAIVVARNNDNG
jgi:hypothetical protein